MKKTKKRNNSTIVDRTSDSFLTHFLLKRKLLVGEILDFGIGKYFNPSHLHKLGYNIVNYDRYNKHHEYPQKRFDTIICNTVLCALKPFDRSRVLMSVSDLLKPTGKAYFLAYKDLEDFPNIILPYKSLFCNHILEIYEYRHYNQIKRDKTGCPFCDIGPKVELICETANEVAFLDGYPVSQGHTLIVPKIHFTNYFDLSMQQQRSLWLVVNHCKKLMERRFHPDGFNVGINVNEAAGQTIPHVHIHLIPRYKGDVENPRGGVRGVIPEKQNY
jgi:diadenosine tetraphosphate (Ap4A) HIT family hydrolase